MKLRLPNKTFTLIVMTDGGAQLRKLRVNGKLVNWVVGGVAALVGVLAIALTVSVLIPREANVADLLAKIEGQEKDGQELRDKLGEANGDVKQLQSKVASVSTSLNKVTEYANRLRRFTHLSDPDRNLALGPLVAPEGEDDAAALATDPTEEEGVDAAARERRKMRAGIMARRMSKMDKEAVVTQKKLEILEKHFKDRQVVLKGTPSIWPTRGAFASGYGMRRDPIIGVYAFHKGIDIMADTGSQVISPADGTVIFAANKGGYGLHILLDHGFGLKTRFGHLSKTQVEVGQKIKRGDPLGLVGSTGRSTGPHLHYEVLVGGVPQNPFRYILD